jgi:hypothetical protein
MDANKHFIVGIFDDEEVLLKGIGNVRGNGVKIHDVYSPFPVHGIDDALSIKRTRLPIAAFMFGLTGTSLALLMQIWMLGYDWPMIIGGKNFASLPPFIPVTFELTVMAIDLVVNSGKTKDELRSLLKSSGASEVNDKSFE